ncbi:hypothetical protein FPQ18DRAFT_410596 [Pyronema domesticum]|nr:hypothetical protein FPQ18DRAFT_410596 [Pyronema domesticum]
MSILVTPLTDRIICQYCSQGSVQLSFNSSDKLLHHLNTHHRHHHHTCPCNPARSLPNDLEFRDHLKTCRLALSLSSTSRSHQQQLQPFAILSDSKLQCSICELEIPVFKFREFDGHMCNPSLDKIIMGCRRYNPQNISAISISAISSLSKMSAKKHQLLSETEQRQNKSLQFEMIFLKEDNNFSCGLCLEKGKEFTAWTSEKLGEHMRTIHPRPMDLLGMVRRCEEGGWVCVKCRAAGARIGWKFENDFEVKRHLSNCHKGVRWEWISDEANDVCLKGSSKELSGVGTDAAEAVKGDMGWEEVLWNNYNEE